MNDPEWRPYDLFDQINREVARITDDDIEDRLHETLARAGYGQYLPTKPGTRIEIIAVFGVTPRWRRRGPGRWLYDSVWDRVCLWATYRAGPWCRYRFPWRGWSHGALVVMLICGALAVYDAFTGRPGLSQVQLLFALVNGANAIFSSHLARRQAERWRRPPI